MTIETIDAQHRAPFFQVFLEVRAASHRDLR